MPRRIRQFLPGTPQLVCQRGNNFEPFLVDERDYVNYLDYLHDAAHTHECAIHAYVLLPNNVLLLLTPACDNSISKMIQSLGRRYVPRFNSAHGRTGGLWESRYRACLVPAEAWLLSCFVYIDTLPVRSGLACRPENYAWSSYRYHALGDRNRLISAHAGYLGLGDSMGGRYSKYQQLCSKPMDMDVLQHIEDAIRRCSVLSSHAFGDLAGMPVAQRDRPSPATGLDLRP